MCSVNGRPMHVSKLRSEFDSGGFFHFFVLYIVFYIRILGADYDMAECSPGDLDPHAVSSVFKAYLRERKSTLYPLLLIILIF